jgi:hypothetical protein
MLTKLPLLKDTCKVREQRDRKTTTKFFKSSLGEELNLKKENDSGNEDCECGACLLFLTSS